MIAQGTPEWHEMRLGKVTGSMIYNVMMKESAAGYQNYLSQLVCERLTGEPTEAFVTPAMEHGTLTEPQARACYTMDTGQPVTEIAFIDHPEIENSGASPDGLVGEAGMIEIKCPQKTGHMKALLGGPIDRKYFLQMQWQMECAGREFCDFVSFNPGFPDRLRLYIQRFDADPECQIEMREAVKRFLSQVDEKTQALRGLMLGDAA